MGREVVVAETSHVQTVIKDSAPKAVAAVRAVDRVSSSGETAQADVASTREAEAELAPMYYI